MAKMMLNAAVLACMLVISLAAQSPFGSSSASPQSAQPTGSGSSSNSNGGNPAPAAAPPSSHNSTEHNENVHEVELSTSTPSSTVVPILFAGNSSVHHANLSVTTPAAEKHTGHNHTSHATTIAVGSSLLLVLIAPLF